MAPKGSVTTKEYDLFGVGSASLKLMIHCGHVLSVLLCSIYHPVLQSTSSCLLIKMETTPCLPACHHAPHYDDNGLNLRNVSHHLN